MNKERTLGNVASKQRQVGKEQLVRAMLEGRTFQQVNERLILNLSVPACLSKNLLQRNIQFQPDQDGD